MMFLDTCLLLIFSFNTAFSNDVLVQTSAGVIKGLKADDGDYVMFLGIPYAQVDLDNPFGSNINISWHISLLPHFMKEQPVKFKRLNNVNRDAAKPHPVFENAFEAYDDSRICPQIRDFTDILDGSLDCLNLNIFVPFSSISSNPLPVFFWIHGGSFKHGSGNRHVFGPRFLVKQDTIVVTINYRLGPYGFMCLGTPEIPGNQGLKDQQLALQWVYKNIEYFGGDLNKITIAGESAGAVSVDMHLLSNYEKLFDKVIIQSGTSLSPVFREPKRDAPLVLAEYLGYLTNDINDALQFLTKANSHLVIQGVRKLGLDDHFRPCIEEEFKGVESFITENWITAKIPKIKNMSVLIGFNSDETHFIHSLKDDEYYQNYNTLKYYLPWGFDTTADDFAGMEDLVRNFYFGDEPMSAVVKRGVIDFESDFLFVHPTYRSISKYLDEEAGDIFLYLFSYVGERNYVKNSFNITEASGAAHCDETGYLFDISCMKNVPIKSQDQLVLDRITTMIANFVKFGNPTPGTTKLLPLIWTPITKKAATPCLNIDADLKLENRPFTQRMTFWDLFYKVNAHLQKAYPSAKVVLTNKIQKRTDRKTEL